MAEPRIYPPWRRVALVLGPALGLLPLVLPPPGALPVAAWGLIGVAA